MKPYYRLGLGCLVTLLLAACSQSSLPVSGVLESQQTETQKITYPAADVAKAFGHSLAIDGDVLVVGAPGPTGLMGQGVVYLYQRDGTGNWQFIKELVARDGRKNDDFGHAVAISGNTVVVGAPFDYFPRKRDQGSAYVFERDMGGANNWGQVKKLAASDGAANNLFGLSVAISGTTVVIGSPYNDFGGNAAQGSVYLYERDQGGSNKWGEAKHLLASDGAVGDFFGHSIAIDGNTVAVGAYDDDIGGKSNQGSAYLYERDQGGSSNWGQVKKLVASDGAVNDEFGVSIAISGNVVVVGAHFDDIGSHMWQGSAYLYERDQGGSSIWGQVKKLVASDGVANDFFGISVAISGNMVVVGVPYNGPNGTGSHSPGLAYLFMRNAGGTNAWGQSRKLLASDGVAYDFFGVSVDISGNTVVASAPDDDIGTNPRQGSVYIFQ
jgi:FG-GAP repeat